MNDANITISLPSLRRLRIGLVALVLMAVLVTAAWQFRDRVDFGGIFARGAGDQIDRSTYQAVFLAGGQVYFGLLQTRGDTYFLLRDVYYLSGDAPPGAQSPGQLIKRGRELHGPQDVMVIPAQSVLFFENLRGDGEVMVAIQRFKSGQLPPSTAAPLTPVPSASPRPSPTR